MPESDLPDPPSDYARRFPPIPEASDLVTVAINGRGRPIGLTPATARAWAELDAAARAAGIALQLHSGFRSVADQTAIVCRKLHAGQSWAEILRVNAYPGFSEHHSGRALDLGVPAAPPLTEAFAETPAFAWLLAHAGEFGFRLSYPRDNAAGIMFEPWHWCWHPASTAPGPIAAADQP